MQITFLEPSQSFFKRDTLKIENRETQRQKTESSTRIHWWNMEVFVKLRDVFVVRVSRNAFNGGIIWRTKCQDASEMKRVMMPPLHTPKSYLDERD